MVLLVAVKKGVAGIVGDQIYFDCALSWNDHDIFKDAACWRSGQ